MPPLKCNACETAPAALKRPKDGSRLCRPCFYERFEHEVLETIVSGNMFSRGDRVAIAASGGKDSTVLAEVMCKLNREADLGLDLCLLSVDEGIAGYRDDSLETVKRNEKQYEIPLHIVSYRDLYGWSMDEIVAEIGRKNNCTFCGVFRRQALDRGATQLGVDKVVTGHNADDIAETVLMNILRGDVPRLERCVDLITGEGQALPRAKPFKYTYEKEIVMYAYFKDLDYFSTECIYSPNAYRGNARDFLKHLEQVRPSSILDIIAAGEAMVFHKDRRGAPVAKSCERCGYLASQRLCKACVLHAGLNSGKAHMAVRSGGVAMALEHEPTDDQAKTRDEAARPKRGPIKDTLDW